MKHSLAITLLLVAIFVAVQLIGLAIVNAYIDHKASIEQKRTVYKELPYEVPRPEIAAPTLSVVYIFGAIAIGTLLLLALIRLGGLGFWRFWFFLSVLVTLAVAFGAWLPSALAVGLALVLALWKVFRPNIWVHNLTELFVYGGLAAIFVPLLSVFQPLFC